MAIFLYHHITKFASPKSIYSIDEGTFRRQLEYLKANNYRVLSLEAVVRILESHVDIPTRSVAITFDDGLYSQFEYAYPILREFGFPACFFIIARKVGEAGYMGYSQIKALAENGMEIGSHGLKHESFDLGTQEDNLNELTVSKESLEKNFKLKVNFFSLPRGSLRAKIAADLSRRAGYRALCLSNPGFIDASSSPFFLNRFAIRRQDTLRDFIKILEANPYKLFSCRINEFTRDCLKRLAGMRNYERLRRLILRGEYS